MVKGWNCLSQGHSVREDFLGTQFKSRFTCLRQEVELKAGAGQTTELALTRGDCQWGLFSQSVAEAADPEGRWAEQKLWGQMDLGLNSGSVSHHYRC